MSPEQINPFGVQTPEGIDADQAHKLFVDIFTDFPQVESRSHSFINGPRGSGKSMMFRMMRADCLRLRRNCSLNQLPYLALYVPIKSTKINLTELLRLDGHPAKYVFNEHLLCLYFAIKAFDELASIRFDYSGATADKSELESWADKAVINGLHNCGADGAKARSAIAVDTIPNFFASIRDHLETYWFQADQFVRRLQLSTEPMTSYAGPLLSYHSFLFPIFTSLRNLSFLPNNHVSILVDDADNLSMTQTEILNSWIASRSTSELCIKASTQLGYKTHRTIGGRRIEAAHDYNEIDVSVLYTTSREHYLQRVEKIVEKRLMLAGINSSARQFFVEDIAQEKQIAEIREELEAKWNRGEGRGARARDDATRYARPEFIRRLGGNRKSRSSYSYSGFEQIAHVSSGVIRWFLEPAARMFSRQKATKPGSQISYIDPHVQNEELRDFSEEFFHKELEEMRKDACGREADYKRLELLVSAMGRTFSQILVNEKRSERRVFSIALSDRPDDEVSRVLELGVKEGYLYPSTIGTKRGHGRTARYVLSRRLAPYFTLDPTSFAGYLFVTNENLRRAMCDPNALLRDVGDEENDDTQIELPIDQNG